MKILFGSMITLIFQQLFRADLITAMQDADLRQLQPGSYFIIKESWRTEWEIGVQVGIQIGYITLIMFMLAGLHKS